VNAEPAVQMSAAGRYETAVLFGDQVHVAGMTPRQGAAAPPRGRIGDTIDEAEARRLVALATNRATAAAEWATRGEERPSFVPLMLTVYLVTTSGFERHSVVADAASDVVSAWCGGRLPARAAVGVRSLPGGAPLEVSLVVGIERRPAPGSRGS